MSLHTEQKTNKKQSDRKTQSPHVAINKLNKLSLLLFCLALLKTVQRLRQVSKVQGGVSAVKITGINFMLTSGVTA